MPQSELLLLSDHEYNISGLTPSYHLCVTVAAVIPSIRGSNIPLPMIYPFGNGKTLKLIGLHVCTVNMRVCVCMCVHVCV